MIKVGIIGAGRIGHVHGESISKFVKNATVKTIADPFMNEKTEAWAKSLGIEKTTKDYHEIFNDPEIEAVLICASTDQHSPLSIEALRAGKHVFCEKPDAINVEEVLKMNRAAEKAGKTLMIMRNNRFSPASQYAKKYIESGAMGDIYCGRCGWQRRRGIPGKGGWFTTKAQSGGGPLIDLGVHMIDLAIWLMGSPKPVTVTGSTYCKFADSDTSDSVNSDFGDKVSGGTFDVEDLAMGTIRFDNGAQLQIEFSWASNIKQENRFVELRGTKSGLTWRDGDVEVFTEMHGQGCDIHPSNLQPEKKEHVLNLINFYDVVIDGKEPVFKPQQGIDMIKILCAIYKSAETGREVVLD